jgi:hypothetical protein
MSVLRLEALAESFDEAPESARHRMLQETAWMGGQVVTVRYYLGRLIEQNLFRVSDEAVTAELHKYLSEVTSKKGAVVISNAEFRGWCAAELLLRDLFERRFLGKSSCNVKRVAAIRCFLSDPTLSLDEIAVKAHTTVKQLKRFPILAVLSIYNPFRPPNSRPNAAG